MPRFPFRPERGLSVAIMGPDGSGKSTIAHSMARSSVTPARVVYMGLSEHHLPRLGRLRLPGLRETVLLVALWTRYLAARHFQAQGGFVLFDRYTYDALLPPPQHLTARQHTTRWVRAHSCPAPDMVILLDVPGQVMYRRKGEHTPQHLEAERSDFLALARRLPRTQVVDGARPEAAVVADIANRVEAYRAARHHNSRDSLQQWDAITRPGGRLLLVLSRAQSRWTGRRQLREALTLAPQILPGLDLQGQAKEWQVLHADWTRTDVAILAVGPARREISAFVKIPWTLSSAESLRAHASVVTELRQDKRLDAFRRLIPLIIPAGTAGGRAYWLEQALPGSDARPFIYSPCGRERLHRAAAEAIAELHHGTVSSRLIDESILQSWVHKPLDTIFATFKLHASQETVKLKLERVRHELTTTLAGRHLNVSWVHGDFWADNLLYDSSTGQVTGILDWDRASAAGLPLLDLVHLLIQTRKLLARDSEQGEMIRTILVEGWSRSELEIFRLGSLPFPLDREGNRIVMLLYWLNCIAILLRQDPERGRRRSWVAKNLRPVLSCL